MFMWQEIKKGMLWKNGIGQNLGAGSSNSVFVLGSDVYVAGTNGSTAKLWKNGVANTLQGFLKPCQYL